MLPEDQKRILGYFIEEAKDHLNTIEQGLLNLQATIADPEMINEVFRAAHSVKGGAAMLGLNSIQRTSHRMEDFFKVIKESPVHPDRDLETMLLQIFDGLQEQLEQLQSPFGLTDDQAQTIIANLEPVFAQAEIHLENLVNTAPPVAVVAPVAERPVEVLTATTATAHPETSALQLVFRSDIPALLRNLLATFKQPDGDASRRHLAQICQRLYSLGEQFELGSWCTLAKTVGQAVSNPQQTYRTLAPVVIKDLKQSQELVLAGRASQVQASAALVALTPSAAPLSVEDDLALDALLAEALNDSSTEADLADLFATAEAIAEDPIDLADAEDWLDQLTKTEPNEPADTDLEAVFGDLNTTPSSAEASFMAQHHPGIGPQVGTEELNSLADLFEGENLGLDGIWEEEDLAEITQPTDPERNFTDDDIDSEFADLFQTDVVSSSAITTVDDDDMTSLFGHALDQELTADPILPAEPAVDFGIEATDPATPQALGVSPNSNTETPNAGAPEPVPSSPTPEPEDNLFTAGDSKVDPRVNTPPSPGTADLDDFFVLAVNPAQAARLAPQLDDFFTEPERPQPPVASARPSRPGSPIEAVSPRVETQAIVTPDPSPQSEVPEPEEEVTPALDDVTATRHSAFGEAEDDPDTIPELNLDLEMHEINLAEANGLFDFAPGALENLPLDDDLDYLFDPSAQEDADPEIPPTGAQDALAWPLTDDFDLFDDNAAALTNDLEAGLDEAELDFDLSFEVDLPLAPAVDSGTDFQSPSPDPLAPAPLNLEAVDNEFEDPFGNLNLGSLDWPPESEPATPSTPDSTESEAEDWQPDVDQFDASPAAANGAGSGGSAIAASPNSPPFPTPLEDELDTFSDLEALLEEENFQDLPAIPEPSLPPRSVHPAPTPAVSVDFLDNGEDDEFDDLEKLLEEADQLGGSAPAMGSRRGSGAMGQRLPRRSGAAADQTMRVSVNHLDNLSNLVGELVVNRNSLEQDQERLRQFLDNLLNQVQQLNDVGQRMRDLYERSLLESSLMANRQAFALGSSSNYGGGHATGATFDALEMDRFTGFHTLSQEMIELIVRVREASSDIEFTIDSTDQIARQFRQVTTQLQEGLNKARMVPFGQTADRLPRAVRDISIKCGKEAKLVVEGRDTLIDKMILERLYDPMTHLVNNAITHGIESPEERLALGKPREGAITVRAFYQGNQTVIYIADNGGGINPVVVKAKALEKGLITPVESQTMTDIEVYDLLFEPGFSTRDQADDFSGRGVGMDVVRTALTDIRGAVTIESEVGKGTSFTIRLPLTLSITKALSCVNNQARIAFPMDGVEDMFDVPKERIQTDDQGHTCILWRDTLLPFRPLAELLKFNRSLGRGRVYGGPQDEDVISIVVLRSASTFIGLQVDQVIGEQEIVIKQLEGPVPKPTGIAGATVLGDGRVMPIADVLELIDLATGRVRREVPSSLWSQPEVEDPVDVKAQSEPTVLIVDDSITVRELLSMSFNKIGYRVEQARDGQEAWEKLRSGLPCDLVFCDIEMPRMDGLELLSRIQKDETLNQLPIAMLTSRGADRHRQMAIDLGAKGYFTKPYLEEMLLDAAQRMLKGEMMITLKDS